jgi:hypothetical protein
MAHIKVSGNVPGPTARAMGHDAPGVNPNDYEALVGGDGPVFPGSHHGPNPYSTTSLSYPLNVEGDSQLGHYIMFFINVIDEGKLATIQDARDARRVAVNMAEKKLATAQEAMIHGDEEGWMTGDHDANLAEAVRNLGRTKADTSFDDPSGDVSNSILLRNRPTKRLTGAISLYMPPNITVNYESKWQGQEVGLLAQTGYEAIKGFMDRGWAGAGETVAGAVEGLEFATRRGIFAAIDLVAPGAKTLFAIERGKIITPKIEVMFEGIGRRSFSYVFTFIPKSKKEAYTVHNIVWQFKYHMAADYVGGGQFAQREMDIPSLFDIQYMHIGKENRNLNKIGTCALTKVDVEYGGDKYVSHEGGVPQTTKLTLAFTELEIMTKDHIAKGY